MASKIATAACGLFPALCACQALPEIQWEAEDPSAVCTGSHAYLDAHALSLCERIGSAPSK